MTSNPSYITKNRLGIYCFQYAIPSTISRLSEKPLKQLFRKSLRTRNRREALKQARFLWLIMDKLVDKYSHDHVTYGKVMELLMRYDSFANCDWQTIEEEFFDQLDDESEMPLLNSALKLRAESAITKSEKDRLFNLHEKIVEYLLHRLQSTPAIQNTELKTSNESEDPKLSVLIQKWLAHKKSSGIKIGSYTALEQRIDIFLQIVNEIVGHEPTSSQLSTTIIREYYELLKKTPAHRNAKNIAGKTFTELSKLGLIPISVKTYDEYSSVVAGFLKWAEGDGFPVKKELAGILKNSKTKSRKNKKNNGIEPLLFNDGDLTKIFNSPAYVSGTIKRASDYWVPLIVLFTGARLGEICQLHLSDIRQAEGVWVIDINDDSSDENDDKSIKNDTGSRRLIPIHKSLKDLGLFAYSESISKLGKTKLFPDEVRTPLGKFDAFSKRFSYQVGQLGIKDDLGQNKRKSFHSLRHNVRTKLAEASIAEAVIDSIVGHSSSDRSIGDKVYTHTQRISQKVKALNNLSYPIDLKLIKKWDECRFSREIRKAAAKQKSS